MSTMVNFAQSGETLHCSPDEYKICVPAKLVKALGNMNFDLSPPPMANFTFNFNCNCQSDGGSQSPDENSDDICPDDSEERSFQPPENFNFTPSAPTADRNTSAEQSYNSLMNTFADTASVSERGFRDRMSGVARSTPVRQSPIAERSTSPECSYRSLMNTFADTATVSEEGFRDRMLGVARSTPIRQCPMAERNSSAERSYKSLMNTYADTASVSEGGFCDRMSGVARSTPVRQNSQTQSNLEEAFNASMQAASRGVPQKKSKTHIETQNNMTGNVCVEDIDEEDLIVFEDNETDTSRYSSHGPAGPGQNAAAHVDPFSFTGCPAQNSGALHVPPADAFEGFYYDGLSSGINNVTDNYFRLGSPDDWTNEMCREESPRENVEDSIASHCTSIVDAKSEQEKSMILQELQNFQQSRRETICGGICSSRRERQANNYSV